MYLEKIELENEIEICGDWTGYCRDIDRYVFKRLKAFVCDYYEFYLMDAVQFPYFRDNGEVFRQDYDLYLEAVYDNFSIGSPAGAEYIRSYDCSPKFRSAENSPLPSRWDGPYWYDGEKLNWVFSFGDEAYAVPPMDFNLNRKLREEGTSREEYYRKLGFSLQCYDGKKEYSFFGKPIKRDGDK